MKDIINLKTLYRLLALNVFPLDFLWKIFWL